MLSRLIFGPPDPSHDCVKIVLQSSRSAFRVFRNEDFRAELNFYTLSQQEQDRIFNELEVTAFVQIYFQTETLIKFHEDSFKHYLKMIKENLKLAHQNILKSSGVEDEHLLTWNKLIDMRLDEYRKDFNEHRSELPNVEEHNPWILVTAVGGYDHITRGRGKPEDPAYRRIVKWLFKLSDDTNKIFLKAIKRI